MELVSEPAKSPRDHALLLGDSRGRSAALILALRKLKIGSHWLKRSGMASPSPTGLPKGFCATRSYVSHLIYRNLRYCAGIGQV